MSNNQVTHDEDFDDEFEGLPKTFPKLPSSSTTPDGEGPSNRSDLLSMQRKYARYARHLPSRSLDELLKDSQCPMLYSTLPKTPTTPTAVHVSNIANRMELDDKLMQDHPMSELLRMEKLRDMPQCLTVKRSIKAQLTLSVNKNKKRKPIGFWKRFKYRTSMFFSRMGFSLCNFGFLEMGLISKLYSIQIGVLTREVASSMELWYHSIKSIEGHFGSAIATYFKFLRWLFLLNLTVFVLSLSFVVIPQSLIAVFDNNPLNGWDLVTGSGFFTTTIMYYGFYSNGTISDNGFGGLSYNIPSAYFMTFLCCYFFTFILLSFKVAISYRKSFIETGGGLQNVYASKIFCGWDFGIASYKAANLRSATIYVELKELLGDAQHGTRRNCATQTYALTIQIAMTTLVLTIMSCTGILLWFLLNMYKSDTNSVWSPLLVPLVITTIMNLLPAFFSWLAQFEGYSNTRTAFYVTMIRTYGMEVVVVGTLLAFWLKDNVTACWQTTLAQEIYRLILVDFVISIVIVFAAQMIRSKLYASKWKRLGAPRFDIARNTLNLIYNETLFWVALYFSPLMSAIIVVKMFLTFYIKKYGVLNHCEPPSRSWRLAQTHTLFLALAFLSMVGTLAILGYILTNVSSIDCGPFRGENYTSDVILEHVLQLKKDSVFWVVIGILTRPGIGAAILIGMGVAVYYLRAQAGARREMIRILREMLVLESRDKEFLLSGISRVADQHWPYHLNPLSLPNENITNAGHQSFVLNSPPRARRSSAIVSPTPRPSVSSVEQTARNHPFSNTVHPMQIDETNLLTRIRGRELSREQSDSSNSGSTRSMASQDAKGTPGRRYDFLY